MNPTELLLERLAATNQQDWDRWEDLHDQRAERTAPELAAPLVGRHLLRAAIEQLVVAFPDYQLDLVHVIADDHCAMARLHTSGTMTGPLTLASGVTIPPTGRCMDQEWMATLIATEGRITAFHEYYDQL